MRARGRRARCCHCSSLPPPGARSTALHQGESLQTLLLGGQTGRNKCFPDWWQTSLELLILWNSECICYLLGWGHQDWQGWEGCCLGSPSYVAAGGCPQAWPRHCSWTNCHCWSHSLHWESLHWTWRDHRAESVSVIQPKWKIWNYFQIFCWDLISWKCGLGTAGWDLDFWQFWVWISFHLWL